MLGRGGATAWMTYPRNGAIQRVELKGSRVVFGRASDCDVVLRLRGVSRMHFEVVQQQDLWIVQDLKSTNGTFVNQRKTPKHQLQDEDTVTLGPPGLVPVVLTFHQPPDPEQEAREEQRLGDSFFQDSVDVDEEPGVLIDEVPGHLAGTGNASVTAKGSDNGKSNSNGNVVLSTGRLGNALQIDEIDEESGPSINASINVADFERQLGFEGPSEPRTAGSPRQNPGNILGGVHPDGDEGPISVGGTVNPGLIIGLFSKLGQALLRCKSRDELLEEVLSLAFSNLPAERGSIWVADDRDGTISASASRSRHPDNAPFSISRTIVNEAVQSQQAMMVSNAIEEFAGVVSVEGMNIRSAMCAPLYHDGRVLGFIYVDTVSQFLAFTQPHLEVLTALAVFAAVGVEKWRLQAAADEERIRREEARNRVEALLDVSRAINAQLDTRPMLSTIMTRARELLNADRGSVFLVDEEQRQLWSTMADGTDTIRVQMDVGLAGYCASSGEIVNVADAYQDPRFNREVDRITNYRTKSVLCYPLRNKNGEIIAVTQLINKKNADRFTAEDEELLGAFCGQAAISLENSILFQDSVDAKHHLECVLQSINQLVLTLDEVGRLTRTNFPCEPRLGLVESDMRKQSYNDWFGTENHSLVKAIARVYESGESVFVADDELQIGSKITSFNYSVVPLLDAADGKRSGVVVVLEDITHQKRVMTTLGRYMSPVLAQKVLDEGGDRLGGVRQDVTVLFSDIRGYTALTEKLDAAQVVEVLNAYFSRMVDGVLAEDGLLDKYIGDALMAVFGVPFPHEDDASRACRSALRMKKSLVQFNEWLADSGLDRVGIGIGISTGSVITGNIGSERRLEYTCIGDSVNVASRLEGVSKIYGVTAVLSEFTRREIDDDILVRELDLIRVVGKQRAIRIYELLGDSQNDVDTRLLRALPHYRVGLEAYRQGHWREAIRSFQASADLADDAPSRLFLSRCKLLQSQGNTGSWDGVWDLTHK